MRNLFVSMIVVFLFIGVSLPAIAQDPPEPEYMERDTHSGNDQRAPVGTTLNAPFNVVVKDENDNKLLGVTVNFSVDKGGTLSATSATTGGFNRTASTTLTFSNTPGLYTVTASVEGLQSISFTAFATTPTNLEKWTNSDSDPVIRSDHQSGVVSTALEYDFVVRVTDQERMPYEGATVNFTVSPSSGTLSVPSDTSDSKGRARTKLTFGSTAGTYTGTARVSGISGSVTFTATATETAAAAVRYHSGMEQSGIVRQELTDPLIVKVTDKDGTAVENARVNFSFGSGSPRGTLNPTTTRTDADGLAQTKLTFGSTTGEYVVNATVPDILQEHARTSIFSVYASSPPPPPEPLAPTVVTSLDVVSGTGQTARVNGQLSRPLIFVAKNQQGGGVANATLNFSVNPTTGTVNPTSATTDSSGRAQTVLTLGDAAGVYTVIATTFGVTQPAAITAIATAAPRAPAGTTVEVVSGNGQTAQVNQQLTNPLIVVVRDENGAPYSGAWVSFSAGSGATFSSPSMQTGSNGQAQTRLTLGSTAGEYTVTVKVEGISDTATFTATATETTPTPVTATATTLTKYSGDDQIARVSQQLAAPLIVVVKDQNGNGFSGATVNFAVSPAGGTLSPTSTTTSSTGLAQTRLRLGSTTGAYTVTASVTGLADVTFTANTAAATTLEVVSGDEQMARVSQQLSSPLIVVVKDQKGNPFSGATVNFTVDKGGTLSPTSTTTGSNGQAQTRLTFGSTTGTYTVTATVGSLSATFTAEPLTATTIGRYSGSGQSGQVSQQLANPLVVIVKDQNGDPFQGATVSFSVDSGGGSVSPTTATTNASGFAQTQLTLGSTAGTDNNKVHATITGGALAIFSATATTGTPTPVTATVTTLTVYSGNEQKGKRNRQLANPLIVMITDQSGNRMSGAVVTFSFKDDSPIGRLSPTRVTTGTNGLAQTRLTLGSDVGTYTVTANVEGTVPVESVEFTANTTVPTTIEIVSGSGQTAGPNVQLSSPLIVLVKDEEGDAFPGASVSFSVTPQNGILNPTSAVTSSNGRAQTRLTLGAVGTSDGVYKVTASVSGVSDTVEFRATLLDNGSTIEIVSGDGQTGVVNRQLAEPLVVVVKDLNGKPLSGVTVMFDAKSGSVSPTSTRTNASGQAQTILTLGPNTNPHDVFVRAVGVGGGAIFTITAIGAPATGGDPASLNLEINGAYSQGQNIVRTGNQFGLTATVTDRNGLPVSGESVSFAVSPSANATLSNATPSTSSEGRATTNLTVSAVGSYTVTATVSGNITDRVTVKAVVTGDIKIEIVSGNEQFRGAGSSVSLVVAVKDANDAPISGARVEFTPTRSSIETGASIGTGGSATVVTSSNGQASTSFRLGSTPGIYTADAEVTIINQKKKVGFTAYATGTVTLGNYRLIKVTSDPVNANYGDSVEITVRISPLPTQGSGADDLIFYIGSFGGGALFTTVPTGLTLGIPGPGDNPGEKEVEVSIGQTASIPDLEPNVPGKTFRVMVDFRIGGVNGTRYFRDSEGNFSSEPVNQPDPLSFTVRVTEPVTSAPEATESPLPPSETLLLPNYPNPFNPETWIPYQLSKPADVSLTIYNLRGVVVREITLGHQPAGLYRSRSKAVHWDGRNAFGERVVSGVYFYMLKAGEFSATRKLLILK